MTDHDPFSPGAVRAAYDAVAREYAERFGDDLAHLPLDRAMLDAALAVAPEGRGWVLDAGCGPAPVAAYLTGPGRRLVGVDLSGAMLAAAGQRVPGLSRAQGDLRRLPLRTGSCALAVAYYSLQHVHRSDLRPALGELQRVLADGGVLLAATHLGMGDVVTDDFIGHRVDPVGGALYARDGFVAALTAAGFTVEDERQRDALPHEHDTRRIYLLCRRDGGVRPVSRR
ncbi:MAG TPA: class I SAM-dependent methyltransferase [Acidimicrobiales bacterium]|nr:class I SAM-dependent methyltransferase [Acidimicrobiales bacterium]